MNENLAGFGLVGYAIREIRPSLRRNRRWKVVGVRANGTEFESPQQPGRVGKAAARQTAQVVADQAGVPFLESSK